MRSKLSVQVSGRTGLSFVDVSHDDMWDLVEQLSNQRVAVTYTYHEGHFTVSFLHLDAQAVQRLLDEWAPTDSSTDKNTPVETAAVATLTP